jgi:hypothetical protein
MPGPSPPSKSYNLQLDTDSEDEEEEVRQRQQQRSLVEMRRSQQTSATPSLLTRSLQEASIRRESTPDDDDRNVSTTSLDLSVESTTSSTDDGNNVNDNDNDNDNDNVNDNDSFDTKSKHKRRRNKRHKKKNFAVQTKANQNTVSFDSVQIRHLERTLGGDGVPSDGGGWPLAVTATVVDDIEALPIDDFERTKQAELQERWKTSQETTSDTPPPIHIETRQWDYKKDRDAKGNSVRNPIFGALTEEERHNLLVLGTTATAASSTSNSISAQSPPKKSSGMMQRLRSRSMSESENTGPYDPVYVRRVRNELEDLRVARTKEDSMGCSCRKVTVHITSQKGGKSKRMAMPKLKEELRKRHALPTTAAQTTRDKLEHLLHDLIEKEGCCSDSNDCPCARDGLQCQADVCTCWSHGDARPKTVQEFEEMCGNENGMYVVDFHHITKFRKDVIAAYGCQVIKDKSQSTSNASKKNQEVTS